MSKMVQDEVQCNVHDKKSYYKDKVKEFVPTEIYDPNDEADMAHLSHLYDL